jgi:hypothetical protein
MRILFLIIKIFLSPLHENQKIKPFCSSIIKQAMIRQTEHLFRLQIMILLVSFAAAKTKVSLNSNNISHCTGDHCEIALDATVSLDQPGGELLVQDPFRNIGYNLSLSSAAATFKLYPRDHFSTVDSTMADQLSCICPVGNVDIIDQPCLKTPLATTLDVTFDLKVSPIPPNDCDATSRSARCCYIVKIWSTDYYHIYTGLSANFDNLKISYHNIDFRLKYGITEPLIDLNVTMIGMTYDLIPLDSLALVMDTNGKARIVNKNFINFPGEYNAYKAGWWKQDVDTAKNNFPEDQMPTNLQGKSQLFQSHLNFTQLKSLPDFGGINVKPQFSATPGERLLAAQIVLQTSPSVSTYSYTTTNPNYINLTLNVDNQFRLVCISYPYICVCSPDPTNPSFNPQKRCLNYKGKILILTPQQTLSYAFLDGTNLLVDADSNLLSFIFEIKPTKVDLRVASNVNIPAITLTDVEQLDIALYNLSSVTYAIFNCSKYPSNFVIETDLESHYFVITEPGIMNDLRWAVPIFKIVDHNGARLQTVLTPIMTTHPSSAADNSNSPLTIMKKMFSNLYFWVSLFFWAPFWIITSHKKMLSPNTFGLSILAALFLFQIFWIVIPCFMIWVTWQSHHKHVRNQQALQHQQLHNDVEMEEFSVVDYVPPNSARYRNLTFEFKQPQHPNDLKFG